MSQFEIIIYSVHATVGLTCYVLYRKFPLYRRVKTKESLFKYSMDLFFIIHAVLLLVVFDNYFRFQILKFLYLAKGNIFHDVIVNFFDTAPAAVRCLGYFLISDFIYYWIHRLLHSKLMWRFHALHHSPRKLNVFTGIRASFMHIFLTSIPMVVVGYVAIYDIGFTLSVLVASAYVVAQHVLHSGFHMPFAKYLKKIIIIPEVHLLHHHPKIQYTNSNYGEFFSLWDHLFGTFQDPINVPEQERGLTGLDYEHDNLSMLTGFNFTKPSYKHEEKKLNKVA